jgi:hypothetical protein
LHDLLEPYQPIVKNWNRYRCGRQKIGASGELADGLKKNKGNTVLKLQKTMICYLWTQGVPYILVAPAYGKAIASFLSMLSITHLMYSKSPMQ